MNKNKQMTYLFYSFKQYLWGVYTIILNGFYYCRFYLLNKKLFSNPPINKLNKDGWEITFLDDFTEDEIDWKKWNKWHSTHTEHTPDEVAGESSLDCIELKDGFLHLYVKDNPEGPYKLKRGWLNTAVWKDTVGFAQQYGYYEIRCKPPTQGLKWWPAFWLYGSTWPPEIDIFEFMSPSDVGKNYTKGISLTTHFGNPGKKDNSKFFGGQLGRTYNNTIDWSKEFHTYAVLWEWNYVEWYIDNVPVYRQIYNVPQNKMSVIVNTAGHLDYLPEKSELPGEFIVDYIRVYKKQYKNEKNKNQILSKIR